MNVDAGAPGRMAPSFAAPSSSPAPPVISLPAGGGAIRGIDEKFTAAPARGTGTLTIPLAVTPGRSSFQPELTLTYDSGAGNGPFGMGWDVALPSVSRRTENGLPRYDDAGDSDVFVLSGAEDLVPALRLPSDDTVVRDQHGVAKRDEDEVDGYRITRYRPRTEGLFARIERRSRIGDPTDVHWRSVSRDNVTTLYGRDAGSRIADPDDPSRIARWLISESHDDRGNVIEYGYRDEDDVGVDLSRSSERHRRDHPATANRYVKVVRYGNRVSRLHPDPPPDPPDPADRWLFEVVFDYGEGHYTELPLDAARPADEQHRRVRASPTAAGDRPVRPDAFSTYRFGFDVRTYRRCERILIFHRMPELGPQPCLVRSTELTYADLAEQASVVEELAHQGSTGFGSFLMAVTQHGYERESPEAYLRSSHPALTFRYRRPTIDPEVRVVDPENVANMPAGLADPVQWVDLDGEGLSGALVEQGGAWWYKRNTGDGSFGALELVDRRPAGGIGGGRRLLDLAGDGTLDLVDLAGPAPGFHERTDDGGWSTHHAFRSLPNLDWDGDPALRFADLDGDGRADVLLTDAERVTWYRSLGEDGFAPAEFARWPADGGTDPPTVLTDGTRSVYLADMNGDGLSDLVRIRNGGISYRPNLGHGLFGSTVVMDDAPWFDHDEQFDQRRVLLLDVDGSGVTDVVYLGRDGTRAYLNRSGNSWSEPIALTGFPPTDNVTSVTAVDLLGNGTGCLVWSSPLPAHAGSPLRYLDLMGGTKPHLLVEMDNGLGSQTVIGYAPSTRFYLADRRAGIQWATRLPFPVHVVERVETVDRISGNRFVTRYAYHHGHWDGVEREFRGFGRVDQWDTDDRTPESAPTDLPPVLTRTWFHTGVHAGGARVSTHLAGEYFTPPGAAALLLDDTVLPPDLDPDDEREACRALRGTMLRQEVYARDGTGAEEVPYTVTEQAMTVRRVQPREGTRHAVFVPHPRESIVQQYERDVADPRVVQEFTLATNRYAQVTRSARVANGRRTEDLALPAPARRAQTTWLAVCTEHEFTDAVDDPDGHRLPAPRQTSTFELTGLPAVAGRLTFDQVRDAVRDAVEIDHAEPPTGVLQKRLVECERIRYRLDDLTGPSDPEDQGRRALVHESHRLAFTPRLLERTFRRGGADLLPDRAAVLAVDPVAADAAGRGGYVDLDGDGRWWVPSGRTFLGPVGAVAAAQELDHARRHFFLPHRYRSPFHVTARPAQTAVGYDVHDLAVTRTLDPLDNEVLAELDYRVLAPRRLTDPNGCRSEVAFDALGLVVATAVRGRDDDVPVRGDTLAGVVTNLTPAQARAAFEAPAADPHALLGSATTRLVHDLFAYRRTAADARSTPIGVLTLARETHVSEAPGATSRVRTRFSYSDGFGREIQQKVPAEPGADGASRWVCSGRVEFNNKGKPVREYEPFFTGTHRPELDEQVGVARTLCYDPLERVVAVLHPNHTFEKVVFDAWHRLDHDVNDTVTGDPRTDPDIGAFAAPLLAGEPGFTTWYDRRVGGAMGAAEAGAAAKAAAHAGTPTVEYVDPLGRTVLSRAHNGFDAAAEPAYLDTQWLLGIEGELRGVTDAAGRLVMVYEYDVLGVRTRSSSMEAGDRWTLADASGTPVREWDSRGHEVRTEYDPLRRPVRRFVMGTDPGRSDPDTLAGALLVEQVDYGESVPNGARRYLRTRAFRRRDGAGTVVTSYDFRGNVVGTDREVATTYTATVDWARPQPPGEHFVASTRYDALNRPIQVVTPHADRPNTTRAVVQPVYNEASLLERLDVWLDRPADPAALIDATAEPPSAAGVAALAYNARGQRTEVVHRNRVTTRYTYDDATFRLEHLYTRRDATFTDDCGAEPPPPRTAAPAEPPSGVPCGVQNLHYTHDPVGNVTRIRDDAQQRVFFRNQLVEPTADFRYDPVYRLVQATGREQLVQGVRVPHSYDDALRCDVAHPGGDALGTYCETYDHDRTGNLLQMRHRVTCPGAESWVRTFAHTEPSLLEDGTGGTTLRHGNRLTSSTVGGTTETYSAGGDGYDAHGNMLRMPQLQVLRWDHADRLRMTRRQAVDSRDAEGLVRAGERTYYVYDASGERVRKVTETATGALKEERLYLGGGIELYRSHAGPTATLVRETLHVTDDEQRVALVETRNDVVDGSPRRVVRYQYGNHLGSASLELDETAQLVSYEEYTPYGSTSFQAVRRDIQVPRKRYRFTGKERDEESGLSYHGARYYAPWLARWTACDPLGLADSNNVYSYSLANPVRYVDDTGGEVKNVVRSDTYRDLLRESFEEVQQRTMTDRALTREIPRYQISSQVSSERRLDVDPAVAASFESKMALFGREYRVRTALENFAPPGWGPNDVDACYRLARAGTNETAAPGDNALSGGGVTLYETETRRMRTDEKAGAVAVAQIRRHIDAGRAVLAGVNEPKNPRVVNPREQPVTDHFVAVYGYETDIEGTVTGLFAKDNAVATTAEVRFTVAPDGSITKPAEPERPDSYLRQEYQMSEVRFHTGFEYTGELRPTDDTNRPLVWPIPPAPKKK